MWHCDCCFCYSYSQWGNKHADILAMSNSGKSGNYKCVQTETHIISTHMNLNRMWQKALIQNVKVIDSNENIEYLCTQIKSQLARHANEIIIIHVKVIFYLSSYFYSWQNEQNKPTIGLFWLWLCVQVALDFLFKI